MLPCLTLIELKRACGQAACPLCTVCRDAEERYLRFFVHEGTNDGAWLAGLVTARGLCAPHAARFRELDLGEYGDGMGTATAYQYVVERWVRDLGEFHGELRRLPWHGHRKQLREQVHRLLGAREGCPVCLVGDRSARHAAATLAAATVAESETDEWRQRFERAAPFCASHVITLVESAPDAEAADYLVTVQLAKWQSLRDELREFLRKCDYRFKDEPKGAENDSWERALRSFRGGTPR